MPETGWNKLREDLRHSAAGIGPLPIIAQRRSRIRWRMVVRRARKRHGASLRLPRVSNRPQPGGSGG